jgi:hypothetical protein
VNILHGIKQEDDPERFNELVEQISQDSSAFALAGLFETQAVIHPDETRKFLLSVLDVQCSGESGCVGEHHLANWPTSF